jgi:hypothetical protein
MQKWKYKQINLETSNFEEIENKVNELASEGWELFSVNVLEQRKSEKLGYGNKIISSGLIQYTFKMSIEEDDKPEEKELTQEEKDKKADDDFQTLKDLTFVV